MCEQKTLCKMLIYLLYHDELYSISQSKSCYRISKQSRQHLIFLYWLNCFPSLINETGTYRTNVVYVSMSLKLEKQKTLIWLQKEIEKVRFKLFLNVEVKDSCSCVFLLSRCDRFKRKTGKKCYCLIVRRKEVFLIKDIFCKF
jgi:hypothetical protein